MTALTAGLLAGAAAAVLLAPGPAALRVQEVLGGRGPRAAVGGSSRRTAPGRAAVLLLPAAAVLATGAGPLAGLVAAAAAVTVVRWRRSRARRTAAARERSRAVEACAALAGELRAGRPPAQALEVAAGLADGPSRASLSAAAAAARLGGDVAGALRPGPATAVPEVLRALSACWTVCAGSGSGLAAAVERLEQGLRADHEQRRAVAAELAGPTATAGMLAVLPLAGLALAAGLGADPLHVLLHTPVGAVCLVLGASLDALGLLWTSRLVARAGGT